MAKKAVIFLGSIVGLVLAGSLLYLSSCKSDRKAVLLSSGDVDMKSKEEYGCSQTSTELEKKWLVKGASNEDLMRDYNRGVYKHDGRPGVTVQTVDFSYTPSDRRMRQVRGDLSS